MTSMHVGSAKGVFVLCFSLLMLISLLPHPASADPIMVITSNTTLTSDVSGSVVLGANNIILDCSSHNISQVNTSLRTGQGIILEGRSGVTVENCRVTGFYVGIELLASKGNTLTGNTASGNGGAGIDLNSFSSGNTLAGNTASNNGADTNLYDGSGINLDNFSSGNTLTDNTVSHNGVGIFLFSSSNGNTLRGNTARNNGVGIFLSDASNGNTLTRNTASNNDVGITLSDSFDGNSLTRNAANDNARYGFTLVFSYNNTLLKNRACHNGLFDAFQGYNSTDNLFSRNSFCTTNGI